MTTPGFGAISSAVARAMSEVRSQHCKPPTYRPAETQRGSIRCPKCGGLVTYTASAIDGRTSGHCSSSGCIKWTD
ncbi:hypothetical protein J2W28_001057 [Variovorax boronicumulans]|uniref:hypothetical protein n=1 Tax=Variovorax boronicumulans TaxID=436515 RepID=UPI0027802175|nr:hypothetical protein [Variovorax boronicumulans]MDP9992029.1 hypothetical protein [Variovorax boronicumulans]MDQ0001924.1 hypothetical protein [Variovorax boronicumulans]